MTISSETIKVVALGDDSTTVFNYDFLIPSTSDVEVIYTNTDGDSTTLAANDYTITGVNNPDGGTVTYLLSGSPIASGTTLTIARSLEYVQTTTLGNQGAFYPAAVDQALDYITMLTQQLAELFSRAIVAPITDPDALLPLPSAVQRALQLLGFDADGNPIAAEPSSALVSTVMQPVVAAATLALARTLLGLGDASTEGIGNGLADDGSGNLHVVFPWSIVSTAQAITASKHLKQYAATGPITFTCVASSTLFNGFGFWVYAFSGAVTIAIDAGDNFKNQAAGASIGVPANLAAWVSTDGAGIWYINASPIPSNLPIQSPQAGSTISRLAIANNSGTPNTKIDISCLEVLLSNASAQIRLASFSGTIDATTNGANGLDTGSLAASTWYFIWIIGGVSLTGTVSSAVLLSLSSTAPTLPSGYTYKQRVGAFLTDSSVHFYRIKQKGNKAAYTVGTNPTVPRIMTSGAHGNPATPVWFAVAVASYIPTTASEASLCLHSGGDGGTNGVAPNNTYDPVTLAPMGAVNAAGTSFTQTFDMVLESTNVYYTSDHTNSSLECLGWIDNL